MSENINEEQDTKRLEERATALQEQMSNKHKREAVKFFDANFDDLDGLDTMVVLAWIADPSKALEDYDNMPLGELQKVVLGD